MFQKEMRPRVARLNAPGGNPTTTYAYDQTGQMLLSTDGCGNASCSDMTGAGHTTTYSHADNFSGGGASAQTNAYVTSITRPSPNGIPITAKYSYRYSDGQVATSTDANSQTTAYNYQDPSTGSPRSRAHQTQTTRGGSPRLAMPTVMEHLRRV